MTCDELFERLTDFLEGELDAHTEQRALEHLSTCNRCEVTLAGTRRVIDLVADQRPVGLDDAERSSLLRRIVDDITSDS